MDAVTKVSDILKSKSLCILCRKPLLDEDCPEASDLDLTIIYDKIDEYPERMTVEVQSSRVFVDVLWVPLSSMLDSTRAASYKILPHLLMESDIVWVKSDSIKMIIDQVKYNIYEKTVWKKRILDQINFGNAALQEASRNLDYPPAALFFLHPVYSYYLMALADCLIQSTMSILTKPISKLRRMDNFTKNYLENTIKSNLDLESNPSSSLDALKRIYKAVSLRCAGQKPQGVTARTLGHFTYSISSLEFEYRNMVIESLIKKGDYMNANFYLRFWAYSLSRCPIILDDSRNGKNPSFYVPFRPFRESVENTCPEIMEDLGIIFGNNKTMTKVKRSIEETIRFKQFVLDQIKNRGFGL
jgi:hypothetical protein